MSDFAISTADIERGIVRRLNDYTNRERPQLSATGTDNCVWCGLRARHGPNLCSECQSYHRRLLEKYPDEARRAPVARATETAPMTRLARSTPPWMPFKEPA
jgi:hypothetical protein